MTRTTLSFLMTAAAVAALAAPADAAVTVQRSGDQVRVVGGTANDVIAVSGGAASVRVQQTSGGAAADLAAGAGCTPAKPPAGVASAVDCGASGLASVVVLGEAGSDKISATGLPLRVRLDGGPGDDALTGGGADDLLIGAAGADILRGGPGLDTASYADAAHGTPANPAGLVGVVATIGGSGGAALADVDGAGDTIVADVEGLIGTASGDNLTGSDGANVLDGAGGGDIVAGAGGSDVVRGGAGDDELDGGDGDDRLEGGDGSDGLRGEAPPPIGGINLAATPPAGSDVLLGGPGPDRLDGGPRDDVLDGGPANDAMQGGDGLDTVDYSARTEPLTVTIGDVQLKTLDPFEGAKKAGKEDPTAPGAPGAPTGVTVALINENDGGASDDVGGRRDAIANDVEVVAAGSGNDALAGNALPNVLRGGAGADLLVGGDAADALEGGPGADDLQARDGVADQRLDCGPDADTLAVDPADPASVNCEVGAVAPANRATVLPLLAPKPRVSVLSRTARLSRRGRAPVRVRCLNVPARCRATLQLVAPRAVRVKAGRRTIRLRKGQVVGRQTFTVWVRKPIAVDVRLTAAARTIIGRRGRLAVRANLAARDDGTPGATAAIGRATRTVTLLKARRARR